MGKGIIPAERIESKILLIRGQKVMLDSDLAAIYGVTTKRLNEQVKRNRDRFPKDFMFQLTSSERAEVVANCDHLSSLKYSPVLPYAFTEHGAVMLASVLNSSLAIKASIRVVRAFVHMRLIIRAHKAIARKLRELESRMETHDEQIRSLFDAIRELMAPPEPPPRLRIGFTAREKAGRYAV